MYREWEENIEIKNKINSNVQWIKDLSEIKIRSGIYFIREKNTSEIIYIGQGGSIGQNLKTRISQYYKNGDEGTISFRIKVMDCPGSSRKEKFQYFKKHYKSNWKTFMEENFEFGILDVGDLDEHNLKLEEAYLIGIYSPKYNY